MALISVLWTVLLVSVLLASALATVRTEIKAAAAKKRLFHAEQAINNIIEHMKQGISSRRLTSVRDLEKFSLATGGLHVRVLRVTDEGDKLDINTATANTLLNVFMDGNLDEASAMQLSDKILDWRDSDSSRREYGAEEPRYYRQGLDPPANRNFFSTRELFRVIDADKLLKPCMLSHLTVFGRSHGQPPKDATSAPPEASEDPRKVTGRKLTVRIAAFDADHLVAARALVMVGTGRSEQPILILGPSPHEPDDECALEFTDNST